MNIAVWILLFFVVDAVVIYFVFRHGVRKNAAGGRLLAGLDFRKLAAFSKMIHEEIGRYLQANYSGDPNHLHQAMQGLMTVVTARAEREGLHLGPEIVKKMIETSAIKHRIAKAGEIRSALERAA